MSGKHYSVNTKPVLRPPTMLVSEMASGAFLVQGYPTGRSVYVRAEDAWALREVLEAIFAQTGSAMDVPPIMRPRVCE